MLTDGSVVDESLLSPDLKDDDHDSMYQQTLLSGLAGVVGNVPVQNLQKQAVIFFRYLPNYVYMYGLIEFCKYDLMFYLLYFLG